MRLPVNRPASLRGRVTWAVLALLTLVLLVLFVVVDLVLAARLQQDARTRLTDRVGLARELDGQFTAQELVDRLRGDGVTATLCSTGGGDCVASSPDPAPPPAGPPGGPRDRAGGPRAPRAAEDTTVAEAGSVLFVRTDLRGGQILTLSVDTTQITDAMNRLIVLEVTGGLAALLLAGFTASRISRRALRPLDDVTALARQIAAGDRGRRLAPVRTDTELGRTAAAFDDMLDELEAALARAHEAEDRMRSFLSDASHELRTPVAGLQANAELILREDLDRGDREQVAVAMVRETRRAGRLVEDLLTMTRLGHGGHLDLQRVDLYRLVEAEAARARTRAPGMAIEAGGDTGVAVLGDPLRLGQIITNLLDNARNAAGDQGAVTLTVRQDGNRATVTVQDSGPGVPSADRETIFERFSRGDTTRSRDTGGAGLGLPIARGWARAHGGDLILTDRTPGACFELHLPRIGENRPG